MVVRLWQDHDCYTDCQLGQDGPLPCVACAVVAVVEEDVGMGHAMVEEVVVALAALVLPCVSLDQMGWALAFAM